MRRSWTYLKLVYLFGFITIVIIAFADHSVTLVIPYTAVFHFSGKFQVPIHQMRFPPHMYLGCGADKSVIRALSVPASGTVQDIKRKNSVSESFLRVAKQEKKSQ